MRGILLSFGMIITTPGLVLAQAPQPFTIVYPPTHHETTATQIFIIGTAPPTHPVTINGQPVSQRSPAGHFAPSIPLQVGPNTITVTAGNQSKTLTITRTAQAPVTTLNILEPAANWTRLPGELVCFTAQAPPHSQIQVQIANQTIPLNPSPGLANLPPNNAALTSQNQPETLNAPTHRGCTQFTQPGNYGRPVFNWQLGSQKLTETAPGEIRIFDPTRLFAIQVTRALGGVARTGPSTDFSRLTPLPLGTQATVTGQTGDFFRLDYGAWINQTETEALPPGPLPNATIRSITSQQVGDWTEIRFPLDRPVPFALEAGAKTFDLKLFTTTAQTDTIRLDADPVIQRLDWSQAGPGAITYRFHLHHNQQWGYRVRYQGSTLILSLRHPPKLGPKNQPLSGLKILLDAGHGGPEDSGARGPTGYPEKDVTLILSQLLEAELIQRGATVIQTRTTDIDLDLAARIIAIDQAEPTLALSLHYNALPDAGDALNTQGIGAFWYQAQSHDLAIFLEDYLATKLNRPQYGVFWNNLALTRPTVAPTVLLEFGFMINPWEFEWITDPQAQKHLAKTLTDGLQAWLAQTTRVN